MEILCEGSLEGDLLGAQTLELAVKRVDRALPLRDDPQHVGIAAEKPFGGEAQILDNDREEPDDLAIYICQPLMKRDALLSHEKNTTPRHFTIYTPIPTGASNAAAGPGQSVRTRPTIHLKYTWCSGCVQDPDDGITPLLAPRALLSARARGPTATEAPDREEHVMSVDQQPDEVVRGEGWLLFAGVMLIAASIMKFFDALWAFRYTGPVQDNLQDSILGRDLSTYGWLWLSVSLVLFICGLGVFVGSQLARWLGIAAAVIAAVTSIWSMPYYPIWSATYIGIAIAVIYALVAYGQRRPAR